MGLEAPVAVHATAVSIGGRGLLIVGPSKSGKSRLALALIDASMPNLPIRLVGDDRVLLTRHPSRVMVRPHPRIAGFIERRGLGIVGLAYEAEAPVLAIVSLADAGGGMPQDLTKNFPVLPIVHSMSVTDQRNLTLRWFGRIPSTGDNGRDKRTTPALENAMNQQGATKDWNW